LAHRPQLLLADEPTAALDPINANRVMQLLLSRARERNVGCLIATHDERLARSAGLAILNIACERDADGGVTATLGEVH
jgi:putative ABC transport system ATP-binding protein